MSQFINPAAEKEREIKQLPTPFFLSARGDERRMNETLCRTFKRSCNRVTHMTNKVTKDFQHRGQNLPLSVLQKLLPLSSLKKIHKKSKDPQRWFSKCGAAPEAHRSSSLSCAEAELGSSAVEEEESGLDWLSSGPQSCEWSCGWT